MKSESITAHAAGEADAASSGPSILVVAGEASGDEHAAGVVRAIGSMRPEFQIFGMGGAKLSEAGMELVVDARKSASVMGLTEVLGSLGRLYAAYRALAAAARRRRPVLAILVDFPDFNLLLAKRLKRLRIPVVYFISPQLWAWRRGRIRLIKKYVAKVIPIFPFEESFYHSHGVQAEYAGHPFLDRPELAVARNEWLENKGLDAQRPVIALLPGSRKAEIRLLLAPMADAYRRLVRIRPGIQAVLPAAQTVDSQALENELRDLPGVRVISGESRECLAFSDAAIVASGTATVEAALAGVPFVVVYKLSSFTYWIGKKLVRGVQHIAMANLIAGRKVVEELLQQDVTGERIALEIERILGDPQRAKQIVEGLREVRERLSQADDGRTTALRVAEQALQVAEPRQRGGRSGAVLRTAVNAGRSRR